MSETASRPIVLRRTPAPPDLAAVERIVRSSGLFREDEVAVAVELVQAWLDRGDASGYRFLFAEVDGRTAAYACWGPIACTVHSHDLYWIAVEQEQRGGGIGRRLLAEVERAVREEGGRRIYIETSSGAGYAPTRAFYESCGYFEEAVLDQFYAPGDSKVIYVKALG